MSSNESQSEKSKVDCVPGPSSEVSSTDNTTIFAGLVFYVHQYSISETRRRVLHNLVKKYGGTYVFKPSRGVTHVLVDEGVSSKRLCRSLDWNTYPPNITVLLAGWVSDSIRAGYYVDTEDYEVPCRYRVPPVNKPRTYAQVSGAPIISHAADGDRDFYHAESSTTSSKSTTPPPRGLISSPLPVLEEKAVVEDELTEYEDIDEEGSVYDDGKYDLDTSCDDEWLCISPPPPPVTDVTYDSEDPLGNQTDTLKSKKLNEGSSLSSPKPGPSGENFAPDKRYTSGLDSDEDQKVEEIPERSDSVAAQLTRVRVKVIPVHLRTPGGTSVVVEFNRNDSCQASRSSSATPSSVDADESRAVQKAILESSKNISGTGAPCATGPGTPESILPDFSEPSTSMFVSSDIPTNVNDNLELATSSNPTVEVKQEEIIEVEIIELESSPEDLKNKEEVVKSTDGNSLNKKTDIESAEEKDAKHVPEKFVKEKTAPSSGKEKDKESFAKKSVDEKMAISLAEAPSDQKQALVSLNGVSKEDETVKPETNAPVEEKIVYDTQARIRAITETYVVATVEAPGNKPVKLNKRDRMRKYSGDSFRHRRNVNRNDPRLQRGPGGFTCARCHVGYKNLQCRGIRDPPLSPSEVAKTPRGLICINCTIEVERELNETKQAAMETPEGFNNRGMGDSCFTSEKPTTLLGDLPGPSTSVSASSAISEIPPKEKIDLSLEVPQVKKVIIKSTAEHFIDDEVDVKSVREGRSVEEQKVVPLTTVSVEKALLNGFSKDKALFVKPEANASLPESMPLESEANIKATSETVALTPVETTATKRKAEKPSIKVPKRQHVEKLQQGKQQSPIFTNANDSEISGGKAPNKNLFLPQISEAHSIAKQPYSEKLSRSSAGSENTENESDMHSESAGSKLSSKRKTHGHSKDVVKKLRKKRSPKKRKHESSVAGHSPVKRETATGEAPELQSVSTASNLEPSTAGPSTSNETRPLYRPDVSAPDLFFGFPAAALSYNPPEPNDVTDGIYLQVTPLEPDPLIHGPNNRITRKLQLLQESFKNVNDKWRVDVYERAILALSKLGKVESLEEVQSVPQIPKKIAGKIWEIAETGHLKDIDDICTRRWEETMMLFRQAWGISPRIAHELYKQGFISIEELKTKAELSRAHMVGLRYYEDLKTKMTKAEARKIISIVLTPAFDYQNNLTCDACSSLRRNKATCGYVSILITLPIGMKNNHKLLPYVVATLHQEGYLIDDLIRHEEHGAQTKYSGIFRIGSHCKYRRVDITVCPAEEQACALLFLTGPAYFNKAIQQWALKKDMVLDQHSLRFRILNERGGTDAVTHLYTPEEKTIFKYLELPNRSPEYRDRSVL